MRKNFQMIIFVCIAFVFILILWFQFFIKNIQKNNTPNQDIENIKNSVVEAIDQINFIKKMSEKETDLENIKNTINQKLDNSEQNNNKDILVQKINEKINNESIYQNNIIEYQYDPWNIKFNYPYNMIKEIVLENNEIKITDNSDKNISIIISRRNQNIEKIINTTKYKNTTYNGISFFETNEETINNLCKKNYYAQIDNYTYTIELKCPDEKKSTYWEILNLTPKSLSKITD